MTFLEFIATACQQALAGADASESTLLNMEQTAESLVAPVFKGVTLAINADPNKRSLLRRTNTITLTTGVGVLPGTILMECLPGGTITDPDDDTIAPDMSYVPDYFDFLEAADYENRLGYWTVTENATTGNVLHYIRPGEAVETKTGDVDLTLVTVPDVPTTSGATLEAPKEFIDMATIALAIALSSKIAKAA